MCHLPEPVLQPGEPRLPAAPRGGRGGRRLHRRRRGGAQSIGHTGRRHELSVRYVKSEYQFIGFIQLEEEQMKGFGAPLNSLWEVMKW